MARLERAKKPSIGDFTRWDLRFFFSMICFGREISIRLDTRVFFSHAWVRVGFDMVLGQQAWRVLRAWCLAFSRVTVSEVSHRIAGTEVSKSAKHYDILNYFLKVLMSHLRAKVEPCWELGPPAVKVSKWGSCLVEFFWEPSKSS